MYLRKLIFSKKSIQPSVIVANAGDDVETYLTTGLSVSASASTTDKPPLTYAWSILSGDSVTINAPTNETTALIFTGIYGKTSILLTVEDSTGNTATDIVNFTVLQQAQITTPSWFWFWNRGNQTGQVTISNLEPNSDLIFNLSSEFIPRDNTISFTDDTTSTTYTLTNLINSRTFSMNNGLLTTITFSVNTTTINQIINMAFKMLTYTGGNIPNPDYLTLTILPEIIDDVGDGVDNGDDINDGLPPSPQDFH